MALLDELLAKQTQLMSSISRALTNFKKLGQAKMTRAVVQSRIASLKEKFAQCQDLDAKITSSVEGKAAETLPYIADSLFTTCEESFEDALDYMSEVLANLTVADPAGDLNVSHASDFPIRPSPQLPRINLPTFNGSFDRWESFRDRFKSLIIDNRHLSNVDRMHYLCSSLSGDASNALNHLSITDANFAVAWEIIMSRYENKRRLINGHLQTLFSLPQLSTETFKDLQNLRDRANMSIQALKNLGRPVDKWDDVLVYIISQKLDKPSRKAWELQLGNAVDYPTYAELNNFLDSRIRVLEAIAPSKGEKPPESSQRYNKPKSIVSHVTTAVNPSCPICKTSHLLYQCPSFLAYNPSQRFDFIKQANRCINCFGSQHTMKNCKNAKSCKTCRQRHHTLLHFNDETKPVAGSSGSLVEAQETSSANDVASHVMANVVMPRSTILLATARVRIYSPQGRFVYARALLDQGSVATIISENIAQCLRLTRMKKTTRITGIGESQSFSHSTAHICVTPLSGDKPAYSTLAYVVKTLSKYSPNRVSSSCRWAHISNLNLADADPMSSDPIDVIIGADLYGMLILDGVRKGTDTEPIAQNTTLGWILSGPISSSRPPSSEPLHVNHGTVLENLDLNLRRFWEVEEVPSKAHLSSDEQKCEEHFSATHYRTKEGRYVVRLPFKVGPPINIGDFRTAALACLNRAEQRLRREPTKAALYRDFLHEYENLGHMIKVADQHPPPSQSYYIPHHAVFRESSITTRLRVVFNASCRTSNGTSLNDHLFVGPKLQTDLSAVILQWRRYRYVYSADITKMYRQILVDPADIDYQRILWRSSPTEPVAEYCLRTVTYGTAPAPYQALRVIKQLTEDEGAEFPLAVPVLRHQIYVDDCTFGADNPELARRIRDQLVSLLKRGGFSLHKWASNFPSLLSDIDSSNHGHALDKNLQSDDTVKILGVAWKPHSDSFQFKVATLPDSGNTKRAILSCIAKLFDPLGWVTPVIVTAKVLIQRLWVLKCDWDDVLPSDLFEQWKEFYQDLPSLESISIPRWTKFGPHALHCELHGFCDASTKAYAAVVYLRLVPKDGPVVVSLLAAKSKVAPVKTLTVPRLELSGALLLTRLMTFVRSNLQIPNIHCHCWTDSTITLAWLNQSPSQWKVFVANRVAEIQSVFPPDVWHHVPTTDNPADCASRGLRPHELANYALWWSGPSWLQQTKDHWPSSSPLSAESDISAEKRVTIMSHVTRVSECWNLATRYSSWPKLLRVTAYLRRFVNNIRCRLQIASKGCSSPLHSTFVHPHEVQTAKVFWLKTMQAESFPQEVTNLTEVKRVAKTSSLIALNPYLDSDGLIRVGGRLEKSNLPNSVKHPIVLRSHPLLSLIISDAHKKTLHGGPQLTLTYLRTEFWILRARATVRAVLYRCVKCARAKALQSAELMGNLPDIRVNKSSRAFEHTGVDYAGPILVRMTAGRGHKAHKAYIALFVCMATKAIHLELVSDYSSAAFIACFNRFVSRRGLPHSMYSDNGTAFQGADRELTNAYNIAVRDPNFLNRLSTDRVMWHFLPPAAPHFGGLWEAGVRSVKHHLKRCVGSHTLTYEEMNTLLCRVEACLNSRPIAATSENLDDYRALTPGHFLIGAHLTAIPEPSVLDVAENRLSRWQLVQRISEGFWRLWVNDYLHALQQRPKWRVDNKLAKIGQIVLIRNPLAPPSHWELGRITACHYGDDGLTRVVTVKTARSEYKRPIVKLCFLPVDINTEAESLALKAGGA